ncbi:MAG: glycosyltransferase [Anaerosomatales bacterium]|nr:glycosyltransferase [Anaerosomatales bacterium]GAV30937.1 glycosyltransferase [Coriobacteriaceae bacterium EMTCatB1]
MGDRVVMILSNDCISDPRVEKEARVLVETGRDVTIIAWDRSSTAPVREERQGFVIERLGPRAAYGAGLKSLPLFRQFWKNAAKRALEMAPDVVHCHDLDTAPAGMRVVRERPSTHLVLDLHEVYRDSSAVPQKGLIGAIARAYVDILERRAMKVATLVFVAPRGAFERYKRLVGERAVLIENAPDANMFRPRTTPRPDRPFTVGYIGSKRYLPGLLMLIDIVKRNDDLCALLVGGGIAADAVEKAAAGCERITTVGRVLYEDIASYYDDIDVSWVLYDPHLGNAQIAFPVKVMESMACGIPMIVYGKTWIGEFVESNGIGIAIDPENAESEGEAALKRLAADHDLAVAMGARGRAIVEEGLSWQAVTERIINAYATLGRKV